MRARIREYLKDVENSIGRPPSITMIGYGTTNRAILEAIYSSGIRYDITVRQSSKIYDTPPYNVKFMQGADALEDICEDVVFASPSVRREMLRLPGNCVITSDTEIFFSKRNDNVFLVSGSSGKSTVTTLTSLLLFPTFPKLFTGGNLGTPLAVAPLNSDAFVIELSSFNLQYCTPLSNRALITNVTPNHLDWHANLNEYETCKKRLLEKTDDAILTLSSAFTESLASEIHTYALVSDTLTDGQIRRKYKTEHTLTCESGYICIDGRKTLPTDILVRREGYNVLNMMSAMALSLGYASEDRIFEVAENFVGLEHRCEMFTVAGRTYIDSSIDTTPERTKATLESLKKPVSIILGGRGKGLSLDPLKDPLLSYAKQISVYGDIGDELILWIDSDGGLKDIPHEKFSAMKDAIDYANSDIQDDVTVLLSPAATAYGEFRNFMQRGSFFKNYVINKYKKI